MEANTLHEMYYDVDGIPVDRDEFYRSYPDGRQRVARTGVFGLGVSTEFVGVNHNADPHGQPWIYETIITVEGDFVYSRWTGDIIEATLQHANAEWRVRLGGFVWWRARNYFQRARAALRRAL